MKTLDEAYKALGNKMSARGCVITDPKRPDNPIVFASQDFLEWTGYKKDEVLGRNCRFLQGTDTNTESVKLLSEAILATNPITITILNYRKDGTPFWNKLSVKPYFDSNGSLDAFIGLQTLVGYDPGKTSQR